MFEIAIDDPTSDDVKALLQVHLGHSYTHSPADDVHALDAERLRDPSVTFFTARAAGELRAIGALRELDARRAELKSMHTVEVHRGSGIGNAMLEHLLGVARSRSYERVFLETGAMAAYAPARSLYTRAGFVECPPFAEYSPSRNSVFMVLRLDPGLD